LISWCLGDFVAFLFSHSPSDALGTRHKINMVSQIKKIADLQKVEYLNVLFPTQVKSSVSA
jgi:hypothetical protein